MSQPARLLARPAITPAARRRDALGLVRAGRRQEAAALCLAIIDEDDDGRQWLAGQVVAAMEQPDLSFAGDLAEILTAIERGSAWSPAWMGGVTRPIVDASLSSGKLHHDLQQLQHLRYKDGAMPLDDIIAHYEAAIARLARLGVSRAPLTREDQGTIGQAYGRLLHVAGAPRVAHALSPSWDRQQVQRSYLDSRPHVVVIDDFLSAEALAGLLHFCQDSTIWAGNRYAHGRLSSLFFTGFNAPLVLQIAEEIRDACPLLIGERHPLRQAWAFKNTEVLPGGCSTHADFAAVNVNFWITPDDANLDPDSGGMVVYDLEAPLSWSFGQYNERADLIGELMAKQRPRAIRIPYRQNRAIIFNSDLFHETEAVCFRPDYLSHRINVTMLYGDRRADEHHTEPAPQSTGPAAWRSAALIRRRRAP
ncbi:MAG: hypothetical protein V4484_23195 [Pseudomonadota bacterium]